MSFDASQPSGLASVRTGAGAAAAASSATSGVLPFATVTDMQARAVASLSNGQLAYVTATGLYYSLGPIGSAVADQIFALSTADDAARVWSCISIRTPSSFMARWPSVMPLGDSTTVGVITAPPDPATTPGWLTVGSDGLTEGYRGHLLNFLRLNGCSFQHATGNNPSRFWYRGAGATTNVNLPFSNRKHQGAAGRTLADMATNFGTYYSGSSNAGGIILSGGINDIGIDGKTAAQTAARLVTLLDTINATAPGIPVLFWSPPAGATYYTQLVDFGGLAKTALAAQAALGRPYAFVDVASYVDTWTEVYDVHPDVYGYRDIAAIIASAMLRFPF